MHHFDFALNVFVDLGYTIAFLKVKNSRFAVEPIMLDEI